jgi:hypothetical protein
MDPTPTPRRARGLLTFGVLISLVGGIGVGKEAQPRFEREQATVAGRHTRDTRLGRNLSGTRYTVELRLDDGSTKTIADKRLYDAVGTRTGVPASIDIKPETGLVRAVLFEGRRYGTGRQTAALVAAILVTIAGLVLLGFGIRRRMLGRRAV